MNYLVSAISDIGQSRVSNQDSLCVKRGFWDGTPVVMAIICDGMGGLSDGELASATVVKRFDSWFETELPQMLELVEESAAKEVLERIALIWNAMLVDLNKRIRSYGIRKQEHLGTTFTGVFLFDRFFVCVHVGDSRVYSLHNDIKLLTEDHTVVNREVKAGRMTPEEALRSPKRSVLTQCVGASSYLKPDVVMGSVAAGSVLLLCSDGFQHKLSTREMYSELNAQSWHTSEEAYEICEELINTAIMRGEKDNISIIVIQSE